MLIEGVYLIKDILGTNCHVILVVDLVAADRSLISAWPSMYTSGRGKGGRWLLIPVMTLISNVLHDYIHTAKTKSRRRMRINLCDYCCPYRKLVCRLLIKRRITATYNMFGI